MKKLFYIILFFIVICYPWWLGFYDEFVDLPAKRSEIFQLSQQVEVLQAAVREKDKYIQQQKTAFRFENLFMLAADHNDMMDFSMLEDMLCEKRGLCKP